MQTSPLLVEPAVRDDVPAILEMILDLATYAKAAHQVETTQQMLEESLFGERLHAEVLMARLDRRSVGFALFFQTYSTWTGRPGLYLEDLFVRPEARGVGAGKALLTRLAQIAMERDAPRLEWAVLDWNEPALGFYERLGAQAKRDWLMHRLSGDALRSLAVGG